MGTKFPEVRIVPRKVNPGGSMSSKVTRATALELWRAVCSKDVDKSSLALGALLDRMQEGRQARQELEEKIEAAKKFWQSTASDSVYEFHYFLAFKVLGSYEDSKALLQFLLAWTLRGYVDLRGRKILPAAIRKWSTDPRTRHIYEGRKLSSSDEPQVAATPNGKKRAPASSRAKSAALKTADTELPAHELAMLRNPEGD